MMMRNTYFTFWLKITIATAVIFLMEGCRTIRTKTDERTKTEVVSNRIKLDNSKQEVLEKINRILENAKSSEFESNLNLIPNENSKILRYVEIREGKPYREIEIQGGSLQEKKTTKDTIYIRDSISHKIVIQKLKNSIDSLQVKIQKLETKKTEEVKKLPTFSWKAYMFFFIIIALTIALIFLYLKNNFFS